MWKWILGIVWKNWGYAAVVAAMMGLATGVYVSWQHSIQAEALAQYNRTQLEQTVQQQQRTAQLLAGIQLKQNTIAADAATSQAALNQQLSDINAYLTTNSAKWGDRASSEVLKQTFTRLEAVK